MYNNPGLSDEACEKLLSEVESDAKMEAMLAVEGAVSGMKIYATEDSARRLVQKMIFMSDKELQDTLDFIGIDPVFKPVWKVILKNQAMATRIWMGENIMGVTTEAIAASVNKQVNDLKSFQSAIMYGEVQPLYMEGEFGNNIRKIVYKKYKFDLAPEDFPHESGSHITVGAGVKGFDPSVAGALFARA